MERNKIIREVLEQLEFNKISYCLLRNYGFLLENRTVLQQSELSVDLVVSRNDFAKFEQILHQLNFLQRDPHYSKSHHAYYKIEDIDVVSFDVQVGGIYWNDFLYLDEKYIFTNRKKKSFFHTLSDNDTYVMLIVHSLLAKRYFKPEYQCILLELNAVIDKEYVEERLNELFTFRKVSWIIKCIQSGDFQSLAKNKKRILASFFLKSPPRFLKIFWFALRYVRWNNFLKAYTLISVIGPDGAGKSTLVTTLEQHLRLLNRRVAVVYLGRGRNTILPIAKLGRAYKKREKQKDLQAQPNISRRTVFYNITAFLFLLDQSLRYFFRVMPKRRNRTFVLVDRYCSDLILMKYVPLTIKKYVVKLFPKPTFTFYLYNTPEILHARRPLETKEELQRQLSLFQHLNVYLKPVEIKTTDPQKDFRKAMEVILHYMFKEWY